MKKVSIILYYNKDRGYLDEALESIAKQTYPNIELIISHSDGSSSYNINEGLKSATGDYVRLMCEDNLLTPDSVERAVEVIEDFDFVHGKAINFWDDGRQMTYEPNPHIPTLEDMLERNRIHGGTVMWKRHCFQWGGFDETIVFAEEMDFNLRLLSKGMKLGYVDHVLQLYRMHGEQKCAVRGPRRNLKDATIRQIKRRYGSS